MNTLAFNDLRHLRSNGMTDEKYLEWAQKKAEEDTRFLCRPNGQLECYIARIGIEDWAIAGMPYFEIFFVPVHRCAYPAHQFEGLDQVYEIVEQSAV